MSRPKIALVLLAITVLGFAGRVVPALPVVFPARDEVRLLGVDGYYHLRHARFASEHFPALQRWDAGTHYPTGQRSDAAGLFDLTIAALAIAISGGEPDELAVLRAAAWMPPLMLLLVFPALYWFARASLSAFWALLACAIFLLSPAAALIRTTLGFADHHVAEILLALLASGGLARHLGSSRIQFRSLRWLAAFGAALPMVGFLFTWLGAPIFALVLGFAVGVVSLFEIARGRDLSEVGGAAFRYGIALLGTTWLVALLAPTLVMERSIFRLTLVGCGVLALGPWALTRVARWVVGRGVERQRAAWMAAACAAATGASLLLCVPEVRQLASLLFAVKTDYVGEHREVSPQRFWILLGPAGVMALLAVPVGAWRAWQLRDRRLLFPLAIGAAWVCLWWRTHDYGYLASPFVAVLAASLAAELIRFARGRSAATMLSIGLAVLLLFPVWPAEGILRPWRSSSTLLVSRYLGEGWFQAMRWLRDNTPTPSIAVDAEVAAFGDDGFDYPAGAYGVLSGWSFGTFVAAIGRRSPVWSRGPDGDPTPAWFSADGEEESLESLCPRCVAPERVRYVVVDARSAADFVPGFLRRLEVAPGFIHEIVGELDAGGRTLPHRRLNPRADRFMAARLYLGDGAGLSHYRMVYESVHQSWLVSLSRPDGGKEFRRRSYPIDSAADREFFRGAERPGFGVATSRGYAYDGLVTASVKVFEVVKGARLEGSAPGAIGVEVRLGLRSAAAREFAYESRVPVAADGGFSLVVPYSTDGPQAPGGTTPRGVYRLRAVGPAGDPVGARHVAVTSDQVATGARIELGPLWDGPD